MKKNDFFREGAGPVCPPGTLSLRPTPSSKRGTFIAAWVQPPPFQGVGHQLQPLPNLLNGCFSAVLANGRVLEVTRGEIVALRGCNAREWGNVAHKCNT
jgi:hypothetical protein